MLLRINNEKSEIHDVSVTGRKERCGKTLELNMRPTHYSQSADALTTELPGQMSRLSYSFPCQMFPTQRTEIITTSKVCHLSSAKKTTVQFT